MGQNIPEIKIGTTMNELRAIVQNQKGLTEAQKTSIFNFIQDEEQFGDKIVTNENELTMLQGWFKSKMAKVKMPDNLQLDEKDVQLKVYNYNQEDIGFKSTSIELSKKVGDGKIEDRTSKIVENSNEAISRVYSVEELSNAATGRTEYDGLYDENNDGIVDYRSKSIITSDNKRVWYNDNDMDGKFDEKAVSTGTGEIIVYKRNMEGKWELNQ